MPFSAAVTNGYTVRLSSGGTNYSALFDVVPANAGVAGNPAPPWAEDVRPTFSSPSASVGSGHGPSAADSVDLTTGVEENRPGPDLIARNPIGPEAVYQRFYRSAPSRATVGRASRRDGWTTTTSPCRPD